MIAGEFQCWFFLKWFYKWLLVRILEPYADKMAQVDTHDDTLVEL